MPQSVFSRRSFLQLGAAGVGGIAFLASVRPAMARAAESGGDPFAVIRANWAQQITGLPYDATIPGIAAQVAAIDATATTNLATMITDAGRTHLWPQFPLGTSSASLRSSFNYLEAIALAYVTPGTTWYQVDSALRAVTDGFQFLCDNYYTPGLPPRGYDNWWDWQIGIPHALEDTSAILYDKLAPDQIQFFMSRVAHFTPAGSTLNVGTGANLLDWIRIFIIRGAVAEQGDVLQQGVSALSPSFATTRVGDGLYADGSFFQHSAHVAYVDGYGLTFFSTIANLISVLGGQTQYTVEDPKIANIYSGLDNGIIPTVWEGLSMDSMEGRDVARAAHWNASIGNTIAFMMLAYSVNAPDDETRQRWRSTVKGWLTRTPAPLTGSLQFVARTQELLADSSVPIADEPLTSKIWYENERLIHRRPGWAYEVASCSARVARYESLNNENLHGWHQGDGWVQLKLSSDRGQQGDGYFVTIDPYRMPGTTVDTVALPNTAGANTSPSTLFSGGATMPAVGGAGEYSAFGQDLEAFGSNLVAKKSWFSLDTGVVALGAGITGTTTATIETIVENRSLHDGDAVLTVDGQERAHAIGSAETVPTARWASLAGVGGYIFLGDDLPRLAVSKSARCGNWMDIDPYSNVDETVTKNFATLSIEHGSAPSSAGYAYLTLPNATAAQTAARSAEPRIEILANTAEVQAIAAEEGSVTAANFFSPASTTHLAATGTCSVVARRVGHGEGVGSTVVLAVSDPSRTQSTVELTLEHAAFGFLDWGSGDDAVTFLDSTTRGTRVLVELGGLHGATVTATLVKGRAQTTRAIAQAVPVAADAYTQAGAKSTNFGSASTVAFKDPISATESIARRGYFAFDTSAVQGTVRRAVLWVHGAVTDGGGVQAQLQAFATEPGWDESTITWADAPAVGAPLGTAWLISPLVDWAGLDVTAAFSGAAPAQASFILQQPDGAQHLLMQVDAKDGGAHPAILELVTAP